MSKENKTALGPQLAYSWGIMLGMSCIPMLALMSKVFPQYDGVWKTLLMGVGLIIFRSLLGCLFPRSSVDDKESLEDAIQTN